VTRPIDDSTMNFRAFTAGFALLVACGVASAQIPAQPLMRLVPAAAVAPAAVSDPSSGVPSQGDRLGASSLTLPLKLVDGHLVVGVTIFNQTGMDDGISFELALDYPDLLTLDGDQHDWLGLSGGAKGQNQMIRVKFSDGTTVLLPGKDIKAERSAARASLHNRMTVAFASELEERKLKGMLGLAFLKNYRVSLDVAAKQLVLQPLRGSNSGPSDFAATFELKEGQMVLPVTSPAGPNSRMILGSSNYDSLIDPEIAQRLGKPAGDVAPVTLAGSAGLDLSRFVVFRPKAWGAKPAADAEAPLLFSGVNLLEAFKLEFDWTNSRVRFVQQKDLPVAAKGDREFFLADAANTADGFQAFLEKNPTNRNAGEAATRLMALRMDEWGVSDDDLLKALQWVIDTSPPERRLDNCITFVNRIAAQPGKSALTIQAGLVALKYSRGAVTVQHVYRLHRILGEQYLEQGDLQAAWSHLMSAAFVPLNRSDPDRALQAFRIALGLGRVYERQERFARAYSRYKAAMAVPGAPMTANEKEEITAALERLRKKIPAEDLQMLDG
jgi:hypothetical protein